MLKEKFYSLVRFLMEIVLIRHGKPTGAIYPKVNAKGFSDWVRKYDESGIVESSRPENNLALKFSEHTVISSDLKRAIESAQICFNNSPTATFKVLRELEIPKYKLPLTLKASNWLYLNRVLWTLRVNGTSESYREAQKRSRVASELLIKLALKHDKVIVFSHGYINFFIRRYLSKKGWAIQEKSNKHWGVTRLKT